MVDVKSTGLYITDPVLKANGASTIYWKTGHSYIKRKTAEVGALAGFEKSGHLFFNPPLGRGYDDGLVAAAAILSMLDRNPGQKLSDLKKSLPVAYTSLTMSPHRADEAKCDVVRADREGGRRPIEALGASRRIDLGAEDRRREQHRQRGASHAGGRLSWVLVRACVQQARELVVGGGRAPALEDDMRALFREEVKPRLAKEPDVGAYNQEVLSRLLDSRRVRRRFGWGTED